MLVSVTDLMHEGSSILGFACCCVGKHGNVILKFGGVLVVGQDCIICRTPREIVTLVALEGEI